MKESVPFTFRLATLIACLFATAESAVAQDDPDIEAKFIDMLENPTLKGLWAPVQQGRFGGESIDFGCVSTVVVSKLAKATTRSDGSCQDYSPTLVSATSRLSSRIRQVRWSRPTTLLPSEHVWWNSPNGSTAVR